MCKPSSDSLASKQRNNMKRKISELSFGREIRGWKFFLQRRQGRNKFDEWVKDTVPSEKYMAKPKHEEIQSKSNQCKKRKSC
jgi:hypothetical protein